MKKVFPRAVSASLLILWWVSASVEAQERYQLRSRPVVGRNEKYVWLHDTWRNQALWKRRLTHWMTSYWSKDGKALAIECQTRNLEKVQTGVMVWREGYRLRFFGVPGGHEYPMGCLWSPDNRRLLVRAGGSGAADLDYGDLFCLKLGRWPSYQLFDIGPARKMAWMNASTVMVWELEVIGTEDNPRYVGVSKLPSALNLAH